MAAKPDPTPPPEIAPTVDPEVVAEIGAIAQKCAGTKAGQVCFSQGPIVAEVQPGRLKFRFWEPGNVTSLAHLQRLKVGAAGSTDGLALLRIQSENSRQAFTIVAFGDLELVAVPGQGFTGNRLVTNPDGSQMCGGSIDLTTSE